MKSTRIKRRLLPTLLVLFAMLTALLPAAVFAAPAAQVNDEPLYFVSGTLPAADSPGRQILLTVNADDTAVLSTDYMNGDDPIVQEGTWVSDEATQSLTVTLTGDQNSEYDTPQVLVFNVDDQGTLTLDSDLSTESYGSDGLTLFFSEDGSQPDDAVGEESATDTSASSDDEGAEVEEALAEESAAEDASTDSSTDASTDNTASDPSGVYVSNILPAADTPGQVVFMILYPDGSVQADTYYLNNEAPISEVGTWEATDEGEVTVSITGTDDADYPEPQELVFTWDGETLSYLSLSLNRIEAQDLAATPVAYYTTDVLPAASSPGLQMSLVLYDDDSANMVNDFMNGDDPIIEVGTWEADDEAGTITVTLTGQLDAPYESPDVIVFSQDGDELTAIEKDEAIYGNNDLIFTEQSLEELPAVETTPAGDDADLEASDSVTGTVPVTGTATGAATEPVTGTSAITDTTDSDMPAPGSEDLSALLSDELANFQTPIGAQAVYVSGFMPSASTPGRVVALILYEDGTTEMLTDYLTGDAPFSEVGTWEEDSDGNITVTLTGAAGGGDYTTPDVIVFAPTATGIEAVDYDQSVYGSEGLTLNEVTQ